MLAQQRQRFLRFACPLQSYAPNQLHSSIFRLRFYQLFYFCHSTRRIPRCIFCQSSDGSEVWCVPLSLDVCKDFLGLTTGDLCSELQYSGRYLVLSGEGGGVEVDYGLVLALMEGIVYV